MTQVEIKALMSNDTTKQETVISIIDGFNKLPLATQKKLNSVFKQFLNNQGE